MKAKKLLITGVALQFPDKGVVFMEAPKRHHDIIHKLYDQGINTGNCVQGFITNDGDFVTRKEGAVLAISTGQIKELSRPPRLFSEDLW